MSGTIIGGRKAAKTNKKLYGKGFYKRIGRKGGQNGHTGGFAANPELARIAGRKGGHKSRRGGTYDPLFNANKKRILKLWYKNATYREIAEQIGLPYQITRRWVRKNVEGKDA